MDLSKAKSGFGCLGEFENSQRFFVTIFILEGREECKCGSLEGFTFSLLQILNYSLVI